MIKLLNETVMNLMHEEDSAPYTLSSGEQAYPPKLTTFALDFDKVLELRKLAKQKWVAVDDLLRAAVDALLAAEGGGESGKVVVREPGSANDVPEAIECD